VDVLDSELSALDAVSCQFHRKGIQTARSSTRSFQNGKRLTASTRNSDVLPAFCSPIMVMSISVALHGAGH
jgi:hypothetical protein